MPASPSMASADARPSLQLADCSRSQGELGLPPHEPLRRGHPQSLPHTQSFPHASARVQPKASQNRPARASPGKGDGSRQRRPGPPAATAAGRHARRPAPMSRLPRTGPGAPSPGARVHGRAAAAVALVPGFGALGVIPVGVPAVAVQRRAASCPSLTLASPAVGAGVPSGADIQRAHGKASVSAPGSELASQETGQHVGDGGTVGRNELRPEKPPGPRRGIRRVLLMSSSSAATSGARSVLWPVALARSHANWKMLRAASTMTPDPGNDSDPASTTVRPIAPSLRNSASIAAVDHRTRPGTRQGQFPDTAAIPAGWARAPATRSCVTDRLADELRHVQGLARRRVTELILARPRTDRKTAAACSNNCVPMSPEPHPVSRGSRLRGVRAAGPRPASSRVPPALP